MNIFLRALQKNMFLDNLYRWYVLFKSTCFRLYWSGVSLFSGKQKQGYNLPRSVVTNPDLNRVINSNEIQSALRNTKRCNSRSTQKRNPLNNSKAMDVLDPNAKLVRQAARQANEANRKKR